jgi:hypothetical protein
MLDSASIIGGKCEPSNGSGKSPGLNQFAFCGLRRGCLVALAKVRTFRRLLPILRKPQSKSIASDVSYRRRKEVS